LSWLYSVSRKHLISVEPNLKTWVKFIDAILKSFSSFTIKCVYNILYNLKCIPVCKNRAMLLHKYGKLMANALNPKNA